MTSPLDTGNRWAVLGVAVFFLGLADLVAEATPALALVNESPSLPRGLYIRRPGPPLIGSIVAIPQPERSRTYLKTLGMPARVLLIKRVAARGGDRVCRDHERVRTLSRTVRALDRDRRGALMPRWSGCRRLEADELFLLGDTGTSFDSRYFGPVRQAAITGVYREVVTW